MELRSGPGRLLLAVYGLLAVAATSRALVQLLGDPGEAPLPYSLSLLSGVVYLVATYALARGHARLARASILLELVGVLVVGTVSLLDSADFPDDTVWSAYGAGYVFVPLGLPVLGLLWLRRHPGHPSAHQSPPASPPQSPPVSIPPPKPSS